MSLDLLTQAAESLPVVSMRILGLVAGLVVLLLALSALIRSYLQGDPPERWLDESEESKIYIDRHIAEFRPKKKDR